MHKGDYSDAKQRNKPIHQTAELIVYEDVWIANVSCSRNKRQKTDFVENL